MFNKILIANRGEIAVRIIHACRELGISTVAIYSDVDRDSLHVQLADEAVCIGPKDIGKSYLNIASILAACEITGAEAVHPGFGFLSESSKFAKMCEACNIKFIGPSSEAIKKLGDKLKAKRIAQRENVPVVLGCDELVEDFETACKIAKDIGYPVMVKATAGGGGKGIRVVNSSEELEVALSDVKFEAESFFGNSGVYIEKFIKNPKHVEIQLLSDEFGNVVYLGERDCSIQRRNQKFIEETPSVAVSSSLREKMGAAAVNLAKACKYSSAGTVEFLMDEDKNFYFMEMNTRIQVEHGITEFLTGVDIVKSQIKIANSEKLNLKQEDIKFDGHSIECRINAENPAKGFIPTPGEIEGLYIPCGNGIRVDNAIYSGYRILPYYDNMIAKVMTYAQTREEAIAKMMTALTEFIVVGIDTNIDFHLSILQNENFRLGKTDVGFLSRLGY